MSLNETRIDIPAEHVSNIFGQFDHNIKLIERTLNVTVVPRNEGIKVIGDTANVEGACKVFAELLQLAERGNMIDEQKVAYTLSLLGEHKEGSLVEIDKDCICHTINGKPVKPKTLGQKAYVDAIRKQMIVFGIGPAGTGKTYLAMAMAITAFKNGVMDAKPVLLEPIVNLKVDVLDKNTGDVMGDLNKRRGRVLGMTPDHQGNTIIEADVPQLEIYGYSTDLRSMTGGSGDFSYEFARYEQAPGDIQQKEIEARASKVDAADE